MIRSEFRIDPIIEFPVSRVSSVQSGVSTVLLRLLLFDDVGLDGDTKVVGLATQVSGDVMIDPVLLEHGRPKIAPQDGGHAEFPCLFEGFRDFDDLTTRLIGTEVNGRTNRNRPQIPCITHRAEHDLVELVWHGQQLVVVDLDDEWDAVGVFP